MFEIVRCSRLPDVPLPTLMNPPPPPDADANVFGDSLCVALRVTVPNCDVVVEPPFTVNVTVGSIDASALKSLTLSAPPVPLLVLALEPV